MAMKMPGVVMRSAVKKPATRLYPFQKRAPLKGTRGMIAVDMTLCNSCTLCMLKCPTGAITVDKANKTWQIDRMRCILCGVCQRGCTRKAIAMKENHAAPMVAKTVELFKAPQGDGEAKK